MGGRGNVLSNDVLRLRLIIFMNEVAPYPYFITNYAREIDGYTCGFVIVNKLSSVNNIYAHATSNQTS